MPTTVIPAEAAPVAPEEIINQPKRLVEADINPADGINTYSEVIASEAGGLILGGESSSFGVVAGDVRPQDVESNTDQMADSASSHQETTVAQTEVEESQESKLATLSDDVDKLLEGGGYKQQKAQAEFIVARYGHILTDETLSPEHMELVDKLWNHTLFIRAAGNYSAREYSDYMDKFIEREEMLAQNPGMQLPEITREKPPSFISTMLKRMGFAEEEYIAIRSAWRTRAESHTRENPVYYDLARQTEALADLYFTDRELPTKLYRTFGIRWFGRYTTEQLASQMKAFENGVDTDPERPTVFVVSAISDHNGALSDVGRKFPRPNARDKSRSGEPRVIFTEAQSQYELARRMLQVRNKFGRIGALFFNAHGNPEGAMLGLDSASEAAHITGRDISTSRAIKRLAQKDIFTPGAEMHLTSCSAGAPEGWAQKLSAESGFDVIASPVPSNSTSIETQRNDDSGRNEYIVSYRSRGERPFAGIRFESGRQSFWRRLRDRFDKTQEIDVYD